MIFAEAKCTECNKVTEICKKSIKENFKIPKCPECSSKMNRIFGSVPVDVAKGIHGNGHTGFAKEFTYKPSKYGKFKGTKLSKKY